MGNEQAIQRRPETGIQAPFEPTDLQQAFALSEQLALAQLVPAHLRGKPADVFLTLLLGRDLGLTAMQAITGIHVIEGKPSVSASTAVALVKRSPLCKYFQLVESTDAVATYETQRVGNPTPTKMSFTIQDASRAGLTAKKNWQNFPGAMLRARCQMALAREVYQDVVANVYDHEELEGQRERADVAPPVTAPVVAPPKPAAPAPKPRAKPAPAPAAEDKVIDITEHFADDAREKTIDDVGPKTAAKPEPAAAATAPASSDAVDELIGELHRAAKSAVTEGKAPALAALTAAAGKVPPLVKAGTITADQRKLLEEEYVFARRVIREDLDFADAFALRETWGK